MSVLQVQEVTKKFGSFTALDGVSLTLNDGEVYGFIGPNGAGKTTTIRILLGILQATSGKVEIFGKDAWKDAVKIHERIAYVPGDVSLWSNLTGGEVIDLFCNLHGTANRRKRTQLLERYDLDPTKKCRTYSKGNRQKVALVAALASDADLFILDEPTSGLDPLMEKIFQEDVRILKQEGKSVLLSSHILTEVEELCDKVSIIRQGKVIETGTLEELRHLARSIIYVETKEPIADLEKQNGIFNVQKKGNGTEFQVDFQNMDETIAFISKFHVMRLESAPPTLEDLFISHYDKNGGAADVE